MASSSSSFHNSSLPNLFSSPSQHKNTRLQWYGYSMVCIIYFVYIYCRVVSQTYVLYIHIYYVNDIQVYLVTRRRQVVTAVILFSLVQITVFPHPMHHLLFLQLPKVLTHRVHLYFQ